MADKFLFIAGVQKGGTSWLAHYVCSRPDVWMHTWELHVFDAEFLDFSWALKRHQRIVEYTLVDAERAGYRVDPSVLEDVRSESADLVALQQDPASYGPYFRRQLDVRPWVRLTGDKTPTYARLRREHWRVVRARLEAAGFEPVVVMSFRDPVERALSHLRMHRAQDNPTMPLDSASVLKWSLAPERRARADYRAAVEAVSAVFPENQRLFLLFEDLFNERSVRRITEFLDLPYLPARFDEIVNKGAFDWTCPPEVRQRLRDEFDATYVFARELFGAEVIDRLWPNA